MVYTYTVYHTELGSSSTSRTRSPLTSRYSLVALVEMGHIYLVHYMYMSYEHIIFSVALKPSGVISVSVYDFLTIQEVILQSHCPSLKTPELRMLTRFVSWFSPTECYMYVHVVQT